MMNKIISSLMIVPYLMDIHTIDDETFLTNPQGGAIEKVTWSQKSQSENHECLYKMWHQLVYLFHRISESVALDEKSGNQ